MKPDIDEDAPFAVTRNACKLCTPLGATLAFKGVAGTLSLLHGSQGCATYIRRYLISHYREPIDIASSNFTEHATVFGGKANLHSALDNLMLQYQPEAIGVATTCLAETIGEDLPGMLRDWAAERRGRGLGLPQLIGVNTPSYIGTHREGYQAAVRAIVSQVVGPELEKPMGSRSGLNLIPGMLSPADLRWLKDTAAAFGLDCTLAPDWSDSLDGGLWKAYEPIPRGGASLEALRGMGRAQATIELGALPLKDGSAGAWLQQHTGQACHQLDLPIGIGLSDRFLDCLHELSGRPVPAGLEAERNRLADSYVDAHKYLAGVPVAVFGEEDFVIAVACFLAETGLRPLLCCSGGKSGLMETRLAALAAEYPGLEGMTVRPGVDFVGITEEARRLGIKLALGSSKGYKTCRELGIPLVRAGFPIHDRFGGGRLRHVGYQGAQELLDRVTNALLENRQEADAIGYTYF